MSRVTSVIPEVLYMCQLELKNVWFAMLMNINVTDVTLMFFTIAKYTSDKMLVTLHRFLLSF